MSKNSKNSFCILACSPEIAAQDHALTDKQVKYVPSPSKISLADSILALWVIHPTSLTY